MAKLKTLKIRRGAEPSKLQYRDRMKETLERMDLEEDHRTFWDLNASDRNKYYEKRQVDKMLARAEKMRLEEVAEAEQVTERYLMDVPRLMEEYDDVVHGKMDKVPIRNYPKNTREFQDKWHKVMGSGVWSEKAKMEYARKIPEYMAIIHRKEVSEKYSNIEQLGQAQLRDIDRKNAPFGTLKSVYNSFARGAVMAASPGIWAVGGEEQSMAWQKASELFSYHEPDGVMDKYLNLAAANAIPMGSTIALASLGGMPGLLLSGAFITSYTGMDAYNTLRNAGVNPKDAATTAVAVGILVGGAEMVTGHALHAMFSRIPGLRAMVGSGVRGKRLQALFSRKIPVEMVEELEKKIASKTLDKVTAAQAAKYLFPDIGRLSALRTFAKEGVMEALTGGVEEWIQEGMQLMLEDMALRNDDLEGVLPRNEDGSIDTAYLLNRMNDAFVAGMILEGGMGVVGGIATAHKRMGPARFMQAVMDNFQGVHRSIKKGGKKMVGEYGTLYLKPGDDGFTIAEVVDEGSDRSLDFFEILNAVGYNQFNTSQLNKEQQEFMARRVLMQLILAQEKSETPLTPDQKMEIVDTSIKSIALDLAQDPLQSLMLTSINTKVEKVSDDMLVLNNNGEKIAIVKSEGLGRTAQEYKKSGYGRLQGAMLIDKYVGGRKYGVSPEVWAEIKSRGLERNVIAINFYNGSTLPHEINHIVAKALKGQQQIDFLNLLGGPLAEGMTERNRMEMAARAQEKYAEHLNAHPHFGKFTDAWAKAAVFVMGKEAPEWAKQRTLLHRIANLNKKAVTTADMAQDVLSEPGKGVQATVKGVKATISGLGKVVGKARDIAGTGLEAAGDMVQGIKKKVTAEEPEVTGYSPEDIGDLAQATMSNEQMETVYQKYFAPDFEGLRNEAKRIYNKDPEQAKREFGNKPYHEIIRDIENFMLEDADMGPYSEYRKFRARLDPAYIITDKYFLRDVPEFVEFVKSKGNLYSESPGGSIASQYDIERMGDALLAELRSLKDVGDLAQATLNRPLTEEEVKAWEKKGFYNITTKKKADQLQKDIKAGVFEDTVKSKAGYTETSPGVWELKPSMATPSSHTHIPMGEIENLPGHWKLPKPGKRGWTFGRMKLLMDKKRARIAETEAKIASLTPEAPETPRLKQELQEQQKVIGEMATWIDSREVKQKEALRSYQLGKAAERAPSVMAEGQFPIPEDVRVKWFAFFDKVMNIMAAEKTYPDYPSSIAGFADIMYGMEAPSRGTQQQMDAIQEMWDEFAMMMSTVEGLTDEELVKSQLDSFAYANIIDIASEVMEKHGVTANLTKEMADAEATGDEVDEEGQRVYAEEITDPSQSMVIKDKKVNPKSSEKMRHIGKKTTVPVDAIVPTTQDLYTEIFSRILQEVFGLNINTIPKLKTMLQSRRVPGFKEGQTEGRTLGNPVHVTNERLTPELLRKHPKVAFLFGDNVVHKGKGGQAVIRDEPNAYGIPTKKVPTMNDNAFFNDDQFDLNKAEIDKAFKKIPGNTIVVIPSAGLGTGLAKLNEKAPKTYAYLQQKIAELKAQPSMRLQTKTVESTEQGMVDPVVMAKRAARGTNNVVKEKPVSMVLPMPAGQNTTGEDTSTIEMAERGERTSTTRSFSLGKPGEWILFKDKAGVVHNQIYEIVQVHRITQKNMDNPAFIKWLSETEGWTEDAITGRLKNYFKVGAYVTIYKKVTSPQQAQQAQGELAQIDSKFLAEGADVKGTQVQVGNRVLNVENFKVQQDMSRMTEKFGPIWPIVLELAEYLKTHDAKMGKYIAQNVIILARQIQDAYDTIVMNKAETPPVPDQGKVAAGFVTDAPQSMEGQRRDIRKIEAAQLPMVLVNWAILRFRFSNDGSVVSAADFGAEHATTAEEKGESRENVELRKTQMLETLTHKQATDDPTVTQVEYADMMDIAHNIIHTDLSAQNFVRQVLSAYAMLTDPGLTQKDIYNKTFQISGSQPNVARSPSARIAYGPSATAQAEERVGGYGYKPTREFTTMNQPQLFASIFEGILNQFISQRKELMNPKASKAGVKSGLTANPEQVSALNAALKAGEASGALLTEEVDLSEQQIRLRNLMDVQDAMNMSMAEAQQALPETYLNAVLDYISVDSEGIALLEGLRVMDDELMRLEKGLKLPTPEQSADLTQVTMTPLEHEILDKQYIIDTARTEVQQGIIAKHAAMIRERLKPLYSQTDRHSDQFINFISKHIDNTDYNSTSETSNKFTEMYKEKARERGGEVVNISPNGEFGYDLIVEGRDVYYQYWHIEDQSMIGGKTTLMDAYVKTLNSYIKTHGRLMSQLDELGMELQELEEKITGQTPKQGHMVATIIPGIRNTSMANPKRINELAERYNYREMILTHKSSELPERPKRPHFPQRRFQNYYAHARFHDLDTKYGKMLYVDEVQSDINYALGQNKKWVPGIVDHLVAFAKNEGYAAIQFANVPEASYSEGYDLETSKHHSIRSMYKKDVPKSIRRIAAEQGLQIEEFQTEFSKAEEAKQRQINEAVLLSEIQNSAEDGPQPDWNEEQQAYADTWGYEPGPENTKNLKGFKNVSLSLKKPMDLAHTTFGEVDASYVMALNMVRYQDKLHGRRDVQSQHVQINSLKLKEHWNEIFGNPNDYKLREVLKDIWYIGIGKIAKTNKRWQQLSDSQKYSMAVMFALDQLNGKDSALVATSQLNAINNRISQWESKAKLTTLENMSLGVFRDYLNAVQLAQDIVNKRGEYGEKVNDYIHNNYKKLTDSYYNLFHMDRYDVPQVPYYSARMYYQDQRAVEMENMFNTSTGRLKGRVFPDLSIALSEGKVLLYRDHISAQVAGTQQVINAIANERFITSSVKAGFLLNEAKEGYKQLSGTKLYAPGEFADYFNTITKPSALRRNPFMLGLLSANAKLKAIRIVWGMFHRRAFVWSAMLAGVTPRNMQLRNKNTISAKDKWKDKFNYGNRRDLGMELMKSNSAGMYGLIFHGMTLFRIQDIGRENLQYMTKSEQYLAGDTRNAFTKTANKYIKQFSSLTARLQNELFGIFGSTLKTATAYNEYMKLFDQHKEAIILEKQRSRNAFLAAKKNQWSHVSDHTRAHWEIMPELMPKGTPDLLDFRSDTEIAILKGVAGLANADFGGIHTARMGMSKTAQDAMRLLFLGPDWTASNVISALKALPSKKGVISGTGTVFSSTELERRIYRNFWLRIMGRSMALMAAINILMAGLDDDDSLRRGKKAWKRGGFKWTMADISPLMHILGGDKGVDYYFNQSGHFLDIPKIIKDPIRMTYHKSSTTLKPVLDAFSGTRYDHKSPVPFWEINEKGLYSWKTRKKGPIGPSQWPAYSIYQIIQFMPIQIRNGFEVFSGESNFLFGGGKAGLGLDLKRTYDKLNKKKVL